MVWAVISKTSFLSEHAIVYRWAYFLSVKILFANTKNIDAWPPNSPDINPLDYHVWESMLEKFGHLNPQPNDIQELKSALTKIWDE